MSMEFEVEPGSPHPCLLGRKHLITDDDRDKFK